MEKDRFFPPGDLVPCIARPREPVWSEEERAWIVSRFADVKAALRQELATGSPAPMLRAVAARTNKNVDEFAAVLESAPIFQNGPTHQASRAWIRDFNANLLTRWSNSAIELAVQRLLDRLQRGSCVDIMPALADALPNVVMAEAFGISDQDVAWLRSAARNTLGRNTIPLHLSPREYEPLNAASRKARCLLRDSSQRMEGQPTSNAFETRCPTYDLKFFLVSAATDTTATAIGFAVHLLAHMPDLQNVMRREPARIEAFVTEVLRLMSPVRRLNRRMTVKGCDLVGRMIEPNAFLILQTESAHRDPAAFPAPDVLDLSRRDQLLVFGSGAHSCMGPMLARSQARIALTRLLRSFCLEPGPTPPSFWCSRDFRRIETLPVQITSL